MTVSNSTAPVTPSFPPPPNHPVTQSETAGQKLNEVPHCPAPVARQATATTQDTWEGVKGATARKAEQVKADFDQGVRSGVQKREEIKQGVSDKAKDIAGWKDTKKADAKATKEEAKAEAQIKGDKAESNGKGIIQSVADSAKGTLEKINAKIHAKT